MELSGLVPEAVIQGDVNDAGWQVWELSRDGGWWLVLLAALRGNIGSGESGGVGSLLTEGQC